MLLASWNVNGLRAVLNKGGLQEFLAKVQPDVMGLQEIKCKPEQIKADFGDYNIIYNSAAKAGYSGTALLVRRGVADDAAVTYNLPDDIAQQYLTADAYGDPNQEGRVITIDLGDYYLVTVYTPNAKSDLSRLSLREQQWDKAFLAYMAQLKQTKPVVFCGDLNVAAEEIDLAHPKQNRGKAGFTDEERDGWHQYTAQGFVDSFRVIHGDLPEQYTWWSHWAHARENNVGWRIDYFMVDERLKERIVDAQIYANQMGSDHCPISVRLQ